MKNVRKISRLVAVTLTACIQLAFGAEALPPPGVYDIKRGEVDLGTYLGWRVFHSNCYSCHGLDALGTSFAPNLIERVRSMTPRAFATKVVTSYQIVAPAEEGQSDDAHRDAVVQEALRGQRGKRGEIIMPAWESNQAVAPHILDLYAYLSARAHGVLPAGKPKLRKP